MTLLVFGRTGQVATELLRHRGIVSLSRLDADLSDPAACADAIRARRPDAVLNAAAYTAVDKAETDEVAANNINERAPAAMARACADLSIPFVHISTDYVFDGRGTLPRRPTDPTAPLNHYGRSKLAGEDAIRAVGGTYAILRTSWVFSAHGSNFVKTMLRLSESRDHLNVVADQIGGPTPASAIAKACVAIATHLTETPRASGTYHFSGAPDISWHGFAKEIFAQAGRRVTVTPIPTAEYPTPATRPLNSRLDCRLTETTFGLPRPDWREALADVIATMERPA